MWDRKQQLELDMEQLIGSKLGKEYDKAVYCPPAYLSYMQNTSCGRLDWSPHYYSGQTFHSVDSQEDWDQCVLQQLVEVLMKQFVELLVPTVSVGCNN